MDHLLVTHGYWAILLGTFLEGETILLLGGVAAHRGWLDLSLVMLAAFAGSTLVDPLHPGGALARSGGPATIRAPK